jgi:hypothetical protein
VTRRIALKNLKYRLAALVLIVAASLFVRHYVAPDTTITCFVVKVESAPENIGRLPVPSLTPENRTLFDKDPQFLCDHLAELKHMSWQPRDYSGDALYDALKRKGYYSMPCLVEKITDTHPAENPTGAPFWAGLTYRVGDTAVLMLMDINNMYWPKGMLAKKYEDMFVNEGVFSYYFYVDEVPGARKKIQRWWSDWLKSCKPECEIVEPIISPRD